MLQHCDLFRLLCCLFYHWTALNSKYKKEKTLHVYSFQTCFRGVCGRGKERGKKTSQTAGKPRSPPLGGVMGHREEDPWALHGTFHGHLRPARAAAQHEEVHRRRSGHASVTRSASTPDHTTTASVGEGVGDNWKATRDNVAHAVRWRRRLTARGRGNGRGTRGSTAERPELPTLTRQYFRTQLNEQTCAESLSVRRRSPSTHHVFCAGCGNTRGKCRGGSLPSR